MGSTRDWLIAMGDEAIIIQHRFSDQLMCVSLSQYRAESKHRYRDWQLRGTAAFIAPPPLACLPVQGPPLPAETLPALTADHAPHANHANHAHDGNAENLAEYVEYDADAVLTLGHDLHGGGDGDDYGYDHDHVY